MTVITFDHFSLESWKFVIIHLVVMADTAWEILLTCLTSYLAPSDVMFTPYARCFWKFLIHLLIRRKSVYPIFKIDLGFNLIKLQLIFIHIHIVVIILNRHMVINFFHLLFQEETLLVINDLIYISFKRYLFRFIPFFFKFFSSFFQNKKCCN